MTKKGKIVAKARLLTAAEELSLAAEIARGGTHATLARERLILACGCLVAKVARKYRGCGIEWDDLNQEGQLGLIRAASDFDPAKGRFTTHAAYWVRQAIARHIATSRSAIRVPEYIQKTLFLKQKRGDILKDRERRSLAMAAGLTVRSLDADRPDTRVGLHEGIPSAAPGPMAAAEHNEEVAWLKRMMAEKLTPMERQALHRRHLSPELGDDSLQAVGTSIGRTKQRAKQLVDNAMRKLRKAADARGMAG